jgi:hypothetical protein
MRGFPETARNPDWARQVSQSNRDLIRNVNALQAPFARRTLTAPGAAVAADYLLLADATAGAVSVGLPAAAAADGAVIVVKKIDASANAVTLDADGAETIDGVATQTLTAQYDAVTVVCDGVAWWIV